MFENFKIRNSKMPKRDTGTGSGVPMHFHGPAFAETLYGRKRWFLTQPEDKPDFHPNKTTLQWLLQDYETLKQKVLRLTGAIWR